MKKNLRLCLWTAAALYLLAAFAVIFITYAQPMQSERHDLSLSVEKDEIMSVDRCQELGWTIFTQEGDVVTPLVFDGFGCYDGLSFLGQTFYYARTMTEELDAASLSLASVNRNYSVFLDGELIYTDCPDQDNRIGHLTLPARDWERQDDVVIPLPEGYVGKTLTIAQSTPAYAETPRMATRAIPSSVTLYCSYAYESALIAESFQTASIGASAYAFGALLLLFFVRRLIQGMPDIGLLFLALAVFLGMAGQMYETSYYHQYFGIPRAMSHSLLCQKLMKGATLAFLAIRSRKTRIPSWIFFGLYMLITATRLFLLYFDSAGQGAFHSLIALLNENAGSAFFLLHLLFSWIERRRGSDFHRWFAPIASASVTLYLAYILTSPDRSAFFAPIANGSLSRLSMPLASLVLALALAITLVSIVRDELERHAEKRMMTEMAAMAQQRYENLRRHNEEVMMLRHDMNRHFQLLRQTATDEKTIAYLDHLLGQNAAIRPVIQTGNDMLDTILCAKLGAAIDAGVKIHIQRATAPDHLPVADADLCSLVMNLMDNAVAAASSASQPVIKLDLHMKSGFFVFVCENTVSPEAASPKTGKTVPKHGLGLKIIHQIAERYGFLFQTEADSQTYKASLAIPLDQPSR